MINVHSTDISLSKVSFMATPNFRGWGTTGLSHAQKEANRNFDKSPKNVPILFFLSPVFFSLFSTHTEHAFSPREKTQSPSSDLVKNAQPVLTGGFLGSGQDLTMHWCILVSPTKLSCALWGMRDLQSHACCIPPPTWMSYTQARLLVYFAEKESLVNCNFHTIYVTESPFPLSLQPSIEGTLGPTGS